MASMLAAKRVEASRYERTVEEPLEHKDTGTLIFVHSICRFHSASIETTRSLTALATPAVLAVCQEHPLRTTLEHDLRARKEVAGDQRHVMQIADGYHRYLQGVALLQWCHSEQPVCM